MLRDKSFRTNPWLLPFYAIIRVWFGLDSVVSGLRRFIENLGHVTYFLYVREFMSLLNIFLLRSILRQDIWYNYKHFIYMYLRVKIGYSRISSQSNYMNHCWLELVKIQRDLISIECETCKTSPTSETTSILP